MVGSDLTTLATDQAAVTKANTDLQTAETNLVAAMTGSTGSTGSTGA